MNATDQIAAIQNDMTAWRRTLHAHPETAFEEHRTADFIAAKLAAFGIEAHRGLAGTGIVGTLRGGLGDGPAIGLRADMDALPIAEKNDFAHRSTVPGKMHACGHDGHSAMLLGAAQALADNPNFAGTAHFIFQPAEENEGGGRVMIEDGLFDRFPMEAVFGLHNMPGMEVGSFAVGPGPMMAAFDIFEIRLTGTGTHAALAHQGRDVIVASAQIVTALQTIISRETDPLAAAVLSVTQIHGGDAWNVLPDSLTLRGTARAFDGAVQAAIEARLRTLTEGICAGFGIDCEIDYQHRYPPTVNDPAKAAICADVAAALVGEAQVERAPVPLMGAEDFAFMLHQRPGAYAWIGNGPGEGGCQLHNPHYDFNDAILPLGARYWVRLTETVLAPGAPAP